MTDRLAKIVYYRSFCHRRQGTCSPSPHLTGPVFCLFLCQYGELNYWIDVSGKITQDSMGNLAFSWITSHSDLPSLFTGKWAGLVTGMQEWKHIQVSTAVVEITVRRQCGSICIFWSAADINSFFFLLLSNIFYKNPVAFQILLRKKLWFPTLYFGRLKKIMQQSRVLYHGRLRWCVIRTVTVTFLPSPFHWCNYFGCV